MRTSIGSAAPPETQIRRLEVSASDKSVWSRETYIVGTPSKTVTRWRSMSRTTASASNRGTSDTHAPAAREAFSALLCPNAWKNGRQPSTTSWLRMSSMSTKVVALRYMFEWVSCAPFGAPVVPEV